MPPNKTLAFLFIFYDLLCFQVIYEYIRSLFSFFFPIHLHIASACIKIECVMFPALVCMYIMYYKKKIRTETQITNEIYQEKGTYLTSHTARSAICD